MTEDTDPGPRSASDDEITPPGQTDQVDHGGRSVTPANDQEADHTPLPADSAPEGERKLRKRAQAAEKRVEIAESRVQAYQRREAETLAAAKLGDGSDLWAGGIQLADCLNADGDIDTDKVGAAVESVLAAHPHWKSTAGPAAPVGAVTSGATKPDMYGEDDGGTWQSVFQAARQR